MNELAAVRVTVRVAVDPLTAFDAFTTEIEQWYRKGAHHDLGARAAAHYFAEHMEEAR